MKLSFLGSINYAATQSGPFTELKAEKDVTVNLEAGEADSTTRGHGNFETSEPTLFKASIEFDMLAEPGEAGFEAFKDAFLNRDSIAIQAVDDGGEGLQGDFKVFGFSRNEGIGDAMSHSVVIKPCRSAEPPSWIT